MFAIAPVQATVSVPLHVEVHVIDPVVHSVHVAVYVNDSDAE